MIKTTTIIALLLTTSTAFAEGYKPPKDPPVQEPPVVTPEPPTVTTGGGGDWIVPLVAIIGVGVAAYALSQPKTSNCDTISNQMIYGADGKPLIAAETDPCE